MELIIRPEAEWENGIPPAELLYSCVTEHMRDEQRLKRLQDYYEGRHQVCARQRRSGLPNNALVHGFPRYICVMTSGYLIGAPVRYASQGQEAALEQLLADDSIALTTREVFRHVALMHESPVKVASQFGITRNNVDQIKARLIARLKDLVAGMTGATA